VDHRADLWSFGLVLYEMVQGTRPPQAVRLRVEGEPDLERIVSKCLETEPERRYQHAADVRTDLARLRRGEGATVAPPAALGRRRARWLAIGAATVVVTAAVAGVIYDHHAASWSGKRLVNSRNRVSCSARDRVAQASTSRRSGSGNSARCSITFCTSAGSAGRAVSP
jgi:serine/threonine protein kinase